MKPSNLILWFKEINAESTQLVGQKGAGLAEMREADISIPNGFCLTSFAFLEFLKNANLILKIKTLLQGIDFRDPRSLSASSQEIKRSILSSKIPEEIAQAIMKNYLRLGGFFKNALVAVRSSPINETIHAQSFLNIKGEANVTEAVKRCWASLFEPENLLKKEDLLEEGTAVLVQRMIQARVSGVMFSTNPRDKKEVIVRAIYGLGELAVEGKVCPDEYRVSKDRFKILKKEVNPQLVQLIKVGDSNKQTSVPKGRQNLQKLTDQEIINLAKLAKKIQQYYFFPQKIEFAIEKRKIYILKTEPITKSEIRNQKSEIKSEIQEEAFLRGIPASFGIASGYARVIKNRKEINKIKKDEILVTTTVDSSFLPVVKKIAGLVTEEKNVLSYGAMVSRELGIPCLTGIEGATKIIKTGTVITINGKTGVVLKGGWQRQRIRNKINDKPTSSKRKKGKKPKLFSSSATKVYIRLNNPQIVDEVNRINFDGVLFEPEFLVSQIGIHPKKILQDKKEKDFIDRLSRELVRICQEFAPKPVIYKILDLQTNQYRALVGGKAFENKEINPLLGFHGGTRYIADPKIFELQLKVIKETRKRGLRNLSLMIPFVRVTRELKEIKKIIASQGLIRSASFKLWLMLEVPSNIFLLKDLIKIGIDGFCLNLPKLLNLVLSVDEENQELFAKMARTDFPTKVVFEEILKITQNYQLSSLASIQEDFLNQEVLESLIRFGINGLCVSPDKALETREMIYEIEKRLTR